MMKQMGLIAVLAAALAGCAPFARPSAQVDLSNPDKVGYIVGSIGRLSPSPFEVYKITICDDQHRDVSELSYKVLMWPLKGPDEKEIVDLGYTGNSFVIALPEGSYEFCAYVVADGGRVARNDRFSIPLKVQAGKANYIGRYMSATSYGKNLIGISVPAAAYWVVNDRQADDMPFVLKRNPAVAGLPVVKAIPAEEVLLKPSFRTKPLGE